MENVILGFIVGETVFLWLSNEDYIGKWLGITLKNGEYTEITLKTEEEM